VKTYGDSFSNGTIVSKVLRSLTRDFDHVVVWIEEAKNLSIYSFDALMSFLLSPNAQINRPFEKMEEKAFQVKGEFFLQGKIKNSHIPCRGQRWPLCLWLR